MKQKQDDCSILTDEDRAKINELLTNHPFSEKGLEDGMQQLTTLNSDQLEKLKNIWRGYEYEVKAKNLKIENVTFNGKTDELESIKIRDGKKVTLFTKDGSKSWTE